MNTPAKFLSSGKLFAVVFTSAVLLALSACQTDAPHNTASSTPQPASADDGKIKGFAVPAWRQGEFRTNDYQKAVQDIRATGATWVSIHSTFFQDGTRGTEIFDREFKYGNSSPDIEEQRKAVQVAHKAGLKVLLKPHVNLRSGEGWRGDIGKGMSERELDEWFKNYGSLLCAHALMAQEEGVEMLAVGTELMSLDREDARWRELIAKVRKYYKGPIVYCANHSTENEITWWDALDYIGIDAYYPLADNDNPTVQSLDAAWQPYVTSCAELSKKYGKKIIFTEIGYIACDGTAQKPFDWNTSDTYDPQEQADCYTAVFQSVYRQPWFDGMFFWNWDIYETPADKENKGYTPFHKPAEQVVRKWFSGQGGN